VAHDPEKIERVQASILQDAQASGYSYVLSQAHQQVSVPLEIATMLHNRADLEFWLATGEIGGLSAKNTFKKG